MLTKKALTLFLLPLIGFLLAGKPVEPSGTISPEERRNLLDMAPREFFAITQAKTEVDLFSPDNSLAAVSVFQATNLLRELQGLKKLRPSHSLYLAAMQHIEDMRKYDFFDHYNKFDRSRRTIRQRVEEKGGDYYIVAENLAKVHPYSTGDIKYKYKKQNGRYYYYDNYDRPLRPMTYGELGKSVVRDWFNSKGHRENLLDPELQYLGVGVIITSNVHETYRLPDVWAVQEFGAN